MTPQKAAIEALERLHNDAYRSNVSTRLYQDIDADVETVRATLRENQGCAVVTVEELLAKMYGEFARENISDLAVCDSRSDFLFLEKNYPNGLVIAPEKKETP